MSQSKNIDNFAVFTPRIVIDSREQLPYSFLNIQSYKNRPLIISTIVAGLQTGDYSLEHFENKICIERKSLNDLYGTLGKGRSRFEDELERMAKFQVAVIVAEAEWTEILGEPPLGRRLSPKSILRSIVAWTQRYPIHFWPMPGRSAAERLTFRILERFYLDQITPDRKRKQS